jgi:hypothetical protein
MSYRAKSWIFWIFSIIFTLTIAIYQRMTGPTHPVRGAVEIANETLKFRLIRTHVSDYDARVSIKAPEAVEGTFTYRRFKSYDEWHSVPMQREGDELAAYIPKQPPAGKVQYKVSLRDENKEVLLNDEPVILRFKGHVPDYVLIPHIILMFLAMLFSTRTGLEALIKGKRTYVYTAITLFLLLPGGMMLGPVVQKFAFGDYWTGWPFGHDMTDNKTAFAFIMWIIAFVQLRRDRTRSVWALIASLVLLAVYLIPHSVMGSEIDFRELEGAVE